MMQDDCLILTVLPQKKIFAQKTRKINNFFIVCYMKSKIFCAKNCWTAFKQIRKFTYRKLKYAVVTAPWDVNKRNFILL